MILLRGQEFKQTNLQKFHYLGGYPGVGGGNVEASNWLTHKCPSQPNFNKSELFSLVQANTNDLLWDKFFVVNLIFYKSLLQNILYFLFARYIFKVGV